MAKLRDLSVGRHRAFRHEGAFDGTGMTELTPLCILVTVMRRRWKAGDLDGAVALAKVAAPYLHGKPPPARLGRDIAGVPDDELEEFERSGGDAAAAEDPEEAG